MVSPIPSLAREPSLRYLQGLEVVEASMQHQEASFGVFINRSVLFSLWTWREENFTSSSFSWHGNIKKRRWWGKGSLSLAWISSLEVWNAPRVDLENANTYLDTLLTCPSRISLTREQIRASWKGRMCSVDLSTILTKVYFTGNH